MFLNIITPCSRPENLNVISESINIPNENYRWIVVFDLENIPKNIPGNAEAYCHKNINSAFGNSQRNFGIGLVENGYVYFNDDDTILDKNLWGSIKDLSEDFISFEQLNKDLTLRLKGDIITLGSIDSHNFIVSRKCIGDIKWTLLDYGADGIFAKNCYSVAKSFKYLDKPLSIYNYLK